MMPDIEGQWFSTTSYYDPKGHLAMSGGIFGSHNCGEGSYQHLVGRGPAIWLNILESIEQAPTTKDYPV